MSSWCVSAPVKKHSHLTDPPHSDGTTNGSVKMNGLGVTLYILRVQKLHLTGYFSAKFKKNQASWIPCEIEALFIAAAVKHFAPYIIQSKAKTD